MTSPKNQKIETPEGKCRKNLEKIITAADLTDLELERITARVETGDTRSRPTKIYDPAKKEVTFLAIGDLHINAKEPVRGGQPLCDFKRFREVIKIGKEEGAEFIIQTGDVTDGEEMRRDQKYHLVVQGWDNVIDYCANEWPESGLTTYFIGGNHDQSYQKLVDGDICDAIAQKRPDLIYLGMNEGNIPLQQDLAKKFLKGERLAQKGPTWIRIRHPSKGTAKSQSYQPQAHVESLASRIKPNILIIGHYHKMDYLFERNVHAFQAGTMEKQSDWMRTKDIAAHLGAWLIRARYKEDGTIDALQKRKLLFEVNGQEKWGKYEERGVYEDRIR